MSLKLDKSTNIGIEIEICIKKDFYKSLQTTKKMYTKVYKYPKGKIHLEKIIPLILLQPKLWKNWREIYHQNLRKNLLKLKVKLQIKIKVIILFLIPTLSRMKVRS